MKYNRLITNLAEKTSDEYVYNFYYTSGQWKSIIRFLLCLNYTEDDVENILRSKYMRLAISHYNNKISGAKFGLYVIDNVDDFQTDYPLPVIE